MPSLEALHHRLDLLHGLYVLEYRNALLWYDLNPLVRDLLMQEGILDVASS